MKNKILATFGAATFGLALSATASFAASLEPGETMGLAALSPLPEGVFFVDNENYGKAGAGLRAGVNIPLVVWSTPWTFYNTRLEFLAAIPFAHLDGAVNAVGAISQAYGPLFTHDFGGGLTGGLATLLRTPDPSQNIAAISGRTQVQADIRGGLYYTVDGYHFYETSWYTGTFGNHSNFAYNDAVGVDFSATKTIDKFELGLVGYAYTDIQSIVPKARGVSLGGELAYDFGKVTLQAQVTHTVYKSGVFTPNETRGWLRMIVPLYVAPAAAPVVARY